MTRRMPPRLARLLDRAVELRLGVTVIPLDDRIVARFYRQDGAGPEAVRIIWVWSLDRQNWKHQASTTTVSRLGPNAVQEIKLVDVWTELGVLAGGERG